ncbi:hypothetical protein CGMCC3_g12596 [Colletotrichum fructicola]|nr:uncharacterized protein CGMCC3_g12596 [Colletotrichum fructicola]KAE9571246.1 hypothetical protein CGMCC3_g12596 [Colletotrichum fructicola]
MSDWLALQTCTPKMWVIQDPEKWPSRSDVSAGNF